MTAQFEILLSAEHFSASGDLGGLLVLHGFTGCRQLMRPLAEAFADAAFTVELSRLPGHDTAVEDIVNYRWSDWGAAADAALRDLAVRTDSVDVTGLSMGGSLTPWLASQYPRISGVVLVNLAAEADDFSAFVEGAKGVLAAGEHYLPAVAGDIADPDSKELGYGRSPAAGLISLVEGLAGLKAALPKIRTPVLLLHSPQDHVISPDSAELLRKMSGGPADNVEPERSFHVAMIDYDGDEINRCAAAFAENVSA